MNKFKQFLVSDLSIIAVAFFGILVYLFNMHDFLALTLYITMICFYAFLYAIFHMIKGYEKIKKNIYIYIELVFALVFCFFSALGIFFSYMIFKDLIVAIYEVFTIIWLMMHFISIVIYRNDLKILK